MQQKQNNPDSQDQNEVSAFEQVAAEEEAAEEEVAAEEEAAKEEVKSPPETDEGLYDFK